MCLVDRLIDSWFCGSFDPENWELASSLFIFFFFSFCFMDDY